MRRDPRATARASVRALSPYEEQTSLPFDLSANTNLFEPNPAIARALRCVDPRDLQGYPSLQSSDLSQAVADAEGVDPACVVTGNGSNDLLDATIRAFADPGGKVAWHPPSFEMIPVFARANAAEPLDVPLGPAPSFALDETAFSESGARVAILCRPNNPTGHAFPRETVLRLLDALSGLVVLDEAYVEFLGDSLVKEAMARENVLVVRTFSKAHGLAGLRIGYGIGHPSIVREIEKVRGPFKLNAFSELAAVESLRDPTYLRSVVARVRSERAFLSERLAALGFTVFPSQTNFLLLRPPVPADRLDEGLAAQGFAVRRFRSGALAGFVRATVPPRDVGERFLSAVERTLADLA
ncbi:MAG TPA: aminotransferase class I/II-fold pyridoxal phosphate-dependent enzyme [Candidatus Thermoplasmatota archaeon]|nr:aminotransferase class I/II-fold pyridoxal phosphate-dependent enzyme [Candidatus Thermoplasmatota archaeon]